MFILLSSLILIVALSMQYYFGQNLAQGAATEIFNSTAVGVSEKIDSLDSQSSELAMMLSEFPNIDEPISDTQLHFTTSAMAQAMRQKKFLYAIYIGYANGDFYELINLDSDNNLREKMGAQESDRWLVIKIYNTSSGRQRVYEFYNEDFRLTQKKEEPSDYFANVRPWYQQAIVSNKTIKTKPYLFHSLQSPGVTYAKKIQKSGNVIAVDIALSTMSHFLSQNLPFKQSQSIIFDANGKINTHSFDIKINNSLTKNTERLLLTKEEERYIKSLGTLKVSNELNWPPFDFSYSGHPQGYSIDMMNLIAQKLGLSIQYSNGYSWGDITSLFAKGELDIVHSIFHIASQKDWGLYSKPYMNTPVALITHNDTQRIYSFQELENRVVAIPSGWSIYQIIKENYPSIKLLAVKDTIEAFNAVASGKAFASMETQQVAQYLIKIYSLDNLKIQPELKDMSKFEGMSHLTILVHEDQAMLNVLLDRAIDSINKEELRILDKKWIGNSDAQASIFRLIEAGVVPFKEYVDMAKQSNTLDFVMLDVINKDVSYTLYVQQIGLGSENYIGFMVPTKVIQGPYMEKVKTSIVITFSALLLLLPLLFYFSDIIVKPMKQLSHENKKIRKRNFREVKPVFSRISEISELSKSMLSMSKSIEQYQKNQQQLMDSFIKLIAQAIDDKSPYTASHCARVPEIAMMLIRQANTSDLPAFRDFKIEREEEWREFEIAAWLHDCGKVTTPEFVVDKGAKLETIYNRIHEVRMRFEVLLRDADIDYWKGIAKGESAQELKNTLEKRKQQIKDDYAFIAQCNVGSESMSGESIARMRQISSQTWVRHLDDRLGLSPSEGHKLDKYPAQTLPVIENLLSDKSEHLVEWQRNPKDRNSDDIHIDIPEYQANLGEIYNLSIHKGTLTSEERYRINEHVIATIRMLETLPFPDELKNIPQYAGGHHETLIGTGYPKKLTEKDLSLKTRVLALADVFEALTACDRPYKKYKTLSETIEILSRMVKDRQIDADLFKLMLSSGVYLEFAYKFLPEEQVDEVDIDKYLSI